MALTKPAQSCVGCFIHLNGVALISMLKFTMWILHFNWETPLLPLIANRTR